MPRRIEPEPYALKVGERLRALRLERNLSLADLAAASDLSKGHLSSIEHGLAAITIQTIFRAAKGLGLPAMYLLTFAGDDERAHIMELVRKLPSNEVTKLRRELTKAAKEAAKAAKPAKAPRGKP
jgi:transcriptional regulator with XRE-family HTH domain